VNVPASFLCGKKEEDGWVTGVASAGGGGGGGFCFELVVWFFFL
jgi:hypothetical protein